MKLWITFIKDLTLSLRSFYIYIEIVMAVIFIAVLLFVVPEEFNNESTLYLSVDLEEPAASLVLDEIEGSESVILVSGIEEIKTSLENDRSAAGLAVSMENEVIEYAFVLQGYESQKAINMLRSAFTGSIASSYPGYQDATTVTVLDTDSQKLSDRSNLLPLFLVLNSAFLGLFIIASYVFMDKEAGTIRAFAVTPCRIWQYLLSKVMVLMLVGLLTGLMMAVAVSGFRLHILPFILLLLVCNGFGSILGLLIASFFDSITKAMGWLYLVIIVLSFSSVSYFMPSFSPLFVRILPTYPMLYAFRQVFLEHPDPGILYGTILVFLLISVALFVLSDWRYRKTITL